MRRIFFLVLGACAGPALQPYGICATEEDAPEDPVDVAQIPLAVELFVPNVDIGVAYYRDLLGFTVRRNVAREHSCFAEVALGQSRILIQHTMVWQPPNDALTIRIVTPDVDALWKKAQEAHLDIIMPLQDASFGLHQFAIKDLYGYTVRFAQPKGP